MRRPEADRARAQMARVVYGWTSAGVSPLEAGPHSRAFIERYDLRADNTRFDWDLYKHMVEPYEDDHPRQVYQAGAQTGKTLRLVTHLLRSGVLRWGSTLGFFFPDKELPKEFSEGRFRPFAASSKDIAIWLGRSSAEGRGVDRQYKRTLGPTQFLFRTTAGKTSTESTPMQGTYFDEVRRMEAGDIQRAMERSSAQRDPIDFKVSTARYPELDINRYFLEGDQRYFHTLCRCPDGIVLSKTFPDCVADIRKVTPAFRRKVEHAFRHEPLYLGMTERQLHEFGPATYFCPKCGEIITDPREGWWRAHNPDAYVHSWQLPQLLTFTYPAGRALYKWTNEPDVQELYNSMLGLAYLDAEAQPVQPHHLTGCVNNELRWTANMPDAWRRRHMRNCALGMDAMGGYNCIVIKKMSPNGKHRTVHVEVAHGDDPFREAAKLMGRYDVRCAVIDCNPHWNEALRFAKAFEGRVFLASYVDEGGTKGKAPMVSWKDTGKKPDQRGDETKRRYSVAINRTNGLKWSLGRWGRFANETPHPDTLIQRLPRQKGRVMLTPGLAVGVFEPVRICRDVYWLHQQKVAFRMVYANDEAKRRGDGKVVAEHLGIDPHFAHANLYADVALQRIAGRRRMLGAHDE